MYMVAMTRRKRALVNLFRVYMGILGCNSGSLRIVNPRIQVNTAEDDEIECVAIVCIEKSIGLVLNTFAVAV